MGMEDKNMGEILYDLLPQIYKIEDSKIKPNPYPLKRFLQVVSVGLDFMKAKIDGHFNMYDVDNTPAEFLPYLAKTLGFEFPYDMTEQEQRNLIKMIPTLYKYKGTKSVFDYLSRQIFGLDAKTTSKWRSRAGANGENIVEVKVEANGDIPNIQTRINRYHKYSEIFRPVNSKLYWSISMIYYDIYKSIEKISESQLIDQLFSNDMDSYNKSKILETYFFDRFIFKDDDSYLVNPSDDPSFDIFSIKDGNENYKQDLMIGESFSEVISINDNEDVYDLSKVEDEDQDNDLLITVENEVYNKEVTEEENTSFINYIDVDTFNKSKMDDSYRLDLVKDISANLNFGMLNSTLILSKKPPILFINKEE